MKQRQSEWVYVLTADDVAELEAALAHAEGTGKAVEVSEGSAGRERRAGNDLARMLGWSAGAVGARQQRGERLARRAYLRSRHPLASPLRSCPFPVGRASPEASHA